MQRRMFLASLMGCAAGSLGLAALPRMASAVAPRSAWQEVEMPWPLASGVRTYVNATERVLFIDYGGPQTIQWSQIGAPLVVTPGTSEGTRDPEGEAS